MTDVKLNWYGDEHDVKEMTVHVGGFEQEFIWIELRTKEGLRFQTTRFKGGL